MSSRLVAFRCPEDLLERVDQLAIAMHVSRTAVLLEAARLFAQHVRGRGGYIIPPYTDKDLMGKLRFDSYRTRSAAKEEYGDGAE